MKTLKDYINEQLIVDEGLLDFLKGFWSWLSGKKNKAEYDVTSASYDENEKRKYINQYTSDSIKYKEIESIRIVDRIVSNSRENGNIQKEGFYNTLEYFKKNPDSRKYQWGSWIFKADDLIETCGLICYSYNEDKNAPVIIFSEFLPIYNSILNMGDIARDINNIDENIMIKDKNLIKMLRREEIKLYQVEGEKDLYTL